MTMPDIDRYPILLFREPEDGSWAALVPDLPGCVAGGDSQTEVLSEIVDAMKAWLRVWGDYGRPRRVPSDGHDMATRLQRKSPRPETAA
jgi:antitoxin HicB